MKALTLLIGWLLITYSLAAQDKPIILLPMPQNMTFTHTGHYRAKHWKALRQQLCIQQVKFLPKVPIHQEEAYMLNIRPEKITLTAITETGIYRGLQTLKQLAATEGKKSIRIPACEIVDWPAFRMRGLMQDVGRSYISMEELKREIDRMSQFKLNVFHWHLTENQAWRLESKRFPQLTEASNMTRMPGKFYTLEEAKELVNYCRERHVLLIPEIDMPGHSAAFTRTFGVDMQSANGMNILKELLKEICTTFEVPYLHIGTDEVQFTNPDFVPEMVAYIRSMGKKVISWNPGWKYQPNEIDMTQLWSYRGKAQKGIPAIDCRFHYLNHFDTYNDLVALYNSRIYNVNQGSDDVAGATLAVWNDRYIKDERQNLAENNVYPCLLALAERSWLGGGTGYFNGKCTQLREDTPENNQAFADFERRLLWHKDHTLKGEPIPYVRQSNVVWSITDAFPNNGDLTRSFPPEETEAPVYVYEGQKYGSRKVYGAGIYLRHVWGKLVPAFYENPKENHTAYATTWIYSPRKQKAGLRLEFQNYSRSESDLPPLPGTWDYQGSRAWINGQELLPPEWINTHRERNNEIPLANENCASRPPLPVSLQKGWNKLMLKLPIGSFKRPEIRLVKWMFTAVLVTPDGQHALPGILYAAERKDSIP